LLPGSVLELDSEAVYNTAVVFALRGELVARYRKVFPWSPWGQSMKNTQEKT
jgi:formamidase